jgi:hypothetical protein
MNKNSLFQFQIGRFLIHIFPTKEFEQWGFSKDWYDRKVDIFGLGPFLLIVKIW